MRIEIKKTMVAEAGDKVLIKRYAAGFEVETVVVHIGKLHAAHCESCEAWAELREKETHCPHLRDLVWDEMEAAWVYDLTYTT